jgi:methyl-accepting chemotaxis protein
MQWFSHLKLRAKLLVGFGVLLLLIAGTGAFAVRQLAVLNGQTTQIADKWLPGVDRTSSMNTTTSDIRIAQFRHVASTAAGAMESADQSVREREANLAATRKEYEPLITSPAERKLYDQFVAEWAAYQQRWDAVAKLSRQDRKAEATALMAGDAKREFETACGTLERIVELNKAGAAAASRRADEVYASGRGWIVAAVALSLAAGIGVALLLANRIARSVRVVAERTQHLEAVCVTNLRNGLTAMQHGDLSARVESQTRPLGIADGDEIGDLARAVDGIIAATQGTVAAFGGMQDTVRGLLDETRALTEAAEAGRLEHRGRAERFEGAFGSLVAGFNGTLDALQAPFAEASAVMQRLAERDVTARMTGQYRGDHAALQTSVNRTLTQLDTELAQVAGAADQVAAAAGQIAAGSQALAGGTTEQASSIEEISATLQEVTSMTGQTAAHAREVQGLVAAATASAERGTARVERLTDAVGRIQTSAHATAKVVKTIDEIAFQTNLLALNAAVEAARAGDAGRGFAVVAEEVRALALRSAEAAKQTASLIEGSVVTVDEGVATNREVAENFAEISGHVARVAAVMREIGAAADQQAESVKQVNSGTEQINQVTQQNAATAEESAAAAEELTGQAGALSAMMARFELGSRAPAAPSAAAPAPRAGRAAAPPAPAAAPAAPPAPAAAPARRPRASVEAALAARAIPFDDDADDVLGGF